MKKKSPTDRDKVELNHFFKIQTSFSFYHSNQIDKKFLLIVLVWISIDWWDGMASIVKCWERAKSPDSLTAEEEVNKPAWKWA